MGPKAGTFVLFLLCLTLLSDARSFLEPTLSEEVSKDENLCTLCEEYVNVALTYLEKNQTQTQILEDLHDRCSHIHGFEQQCITLVDYYLPLFFLHIESFQPHYFCKSMNLCGRVVALVEEARQDTCGVCHKTVSEILIKLQDPDTQLDIVEMLLKACKSFKNHEYEKKCKRLVFEYGPIILVNAEEFLVKNDICTLLRACPNQKSVLRQPGSVLADS